MKKLQPKNSGGLTLIELLVVIAIIGILASLIFPVVSSARRTGLGIQCVSNLKQDGAAILLYADENKDFLPGPCEYGQRCYYFNTTATNGRFNTELAYHLATYLGAEDPRQMSDTASNYLKTMFCPGYGEFLPAAPTIGMTAITYISAYPFNNGLVNLSVNPFGYPGTGPAQSFGTSPVMLTSLHQYGPVSDIFALSDVDTKLYSGWPLEATIPNHGKIRNALYFDGHVKSYRGTNFVEVY